MLHAYARTRVRAGGGVETQQDHKSHVCISLTSKVEVGKYGIEGKTKKVKEEPRRNLCPYVS